MTEGRRFRCQVVAVRRVVLNDRSCLFWARDLALCPSQQPDISLFSVVARQCILTSGI